MKLHLPTGLLAALIAAFAVVGSAAFTADAATTTFTTTNSSSAGTTNDYNTHGFVIILDGPRLETSSNPSGALIDWCDEVNLVSVTLNNLRHNPPAGDQVGLALADANGVVRSLSNNAASGSGQFTWNFTDTTVATDSSLYFYFYKTESAPMTVGQTLTATDLYQNGCGGSGVSSYGNTDSVSCGFLNGVTSVQSNVYGPKLSIVTTGTPVEPDKYVWAGVESGAAWDTQTKNWTVNGSAATYLSAANTVATFGTAPTAKAVTVTENILAGQVSVDDNYAFTIESGSSLTVGALAVADGKTATMAGEGTISLGTVRGTLAISSGTTVAMSTMPDLAAVTMEDGATLDLSSFSASIGNIKSIANGVTGDKTVRISAEGERAFDNGQTTNLLTNLEFITSSEFNGSGWSAERVGHVLNVGDGSQAASIKVAQDLRLESKLTLNIASGSSTVVGGELILGHKQPGNPGLVNVNGGTLTVGHIRPWDAATPNTVSLYDGTLEITQSGEVFTGDGATSTVTTFASSGASTVKNLSGGDITWNHAATVDGTLTLDTGAQNATFAGALEGAGTLDKAGAGTLVLEIPVLPPATTSDPIPTNAATSVGVTVSEGTLRLGTAELEIPTIIVGAGATLDATGEVSTKTAVTLGAGSTLAVGESGLVLLDDSSLNLPGTGTFKFQYGGTVGSQVVIATGLSIDHIFGVTFTQDASTGEWYADASCVTVDAPLQALNQLRLLGTGDLVLTKATGGGSYWGAGKESGPWDLNTENWAKADGDTASGTFTNGSDAYFTANGGGGEISVGTGINVTTINVSGSKAYTFTNADRLTISGGINVSDSGKATFDKLGGEIKSISIADADSALTVSNGGASVQTLNNAGTLTVKDTLTLKTATTNGGNVTAKNLTLTGENAFAAVNVAGTVSGAASIKVGGTSVIGTLSGVNKLNLADGTLKLDAATGLNETTLSGALTAGGGVGLGSVAMNHGSSIQSTGEVSASGITVTGTADILAGTKLQTATVGGTGTLKVASGSTVGGSNLSVADNATLELLEGSTLANTGTLSVAGKVIAGNGINLGTANVSGTLTSTGTLTVDNNLTVNGAASVENVVIGGNLAMGAASGALTATGTLNAGTITLGRVSAAECYITANALGTTATDFVVDEAYITSQGFGVGTVITLADLATDFAGSVTINGKSSFTDDNRRVYTIAKNSGDHDIVLTVEQQESGFVWTGNEDTLWSTSGNWSGGTVPGSEDWVQVKGDTHTIELDVDPTVNYFSVSAQSATLQGEHTLQVGSALEVNVNGILYVGDASAPTAIETPTATINGTLVVQPRSTVQADATTIDGGTLNVNNASYIAETIDMSEGTLRTSSDSSVATGQLNGDPDSTVGGNVTIYGNGGRYTGGYDDAHIEVIEDADATFYAGEGLNLHGDGTAKLQYSGDTAIGGVDAGDLDIILNDPTSSNIGSTLTLQNPSAMEAGSITFGMSAIDSAATINSNRIPVIIDATDFAVGNETTVVVNQDKTQDTGIAMAVGNNGKTRNLVLARVGADNTNTDSVVLNGNLYGKYFKNARIEHGALLVDMNDTYYQTISGATSFNGRAGAGMLDDAFVENNPQISNPTGDLAAVMTALEQGAISSQEADRVLSAMSGASHAAMGAAWSRDVDRQLRAIRNRTTSMGVAECVVNEDMPFINVWINAEGDYTKLNNDGTLAGYKLSSWGGTVGVDVDFTNRFTMGLAVTAMSGDFTACSADNAEGDLDRLYVSVFGRYTHRAWTHTLVGTFGMADTDLKRTVDYGVGSYTTNSSSDGTAFGLMYEVGYTIALNENATTCLQPVLNLSYRHSSLDGCSETGTDAALRGDDVDMDVFTIALGARLQSVVGTSVYNRSSIFEGRVLCKLDAGDREASTHNSFVNVGNKHEVRSSEMGAFGLELGAGLVVPIAEDGGSIFFDVSAEIRDKYTEVNGTVGYRYNF